MGVPKKQSMYWRGFIVALVLCCVGTIGYSSVSKSSSESEGCMRQGSYKFVHYRSLENDPRCRFKGGKEVIRQSGYTVLTPTVDGFSFSAGDDNRWQLTATCTGSAITQVKITLYNKCKHQYVTTSYSQADVTLENRVFRIHKYPLELTCGGPGICHSTEYWSLAAEIF